MRHVYKAQAVLCLAGAPSPEEHALQLILACNNASLGKPCSAWQVHCVSAFGKLQELLQQHSPFPDGLILHSWIGSADMVKSLGKLEGVFFSLSGHLTHMSRKKYEPMIKQVMIPLLGFPERCECCIHACILLQVVQCCQCCSMSVTPDSSYRYLVLHVIQ